MQHGLHHAEPETLIPKRGHQQQARPLHHLRDVFAVGQQRHIRAAFQLFAIGAGGAPARQRAELVLRQAVGQREKNRDALYRAGIDQGDQAALEQP